MINFLKYFGISVLPILGSLVSCSEDHEVEEKVRVNWMTFNGVEYQLTENLFSTVDYECTYWDCSMYLWLKGENLEEEKRLSVFIKLVDFDATFEDDPYVFEGTFQGYFYSGQTKIVYASTIHYYNQIESWSSAPSASYNVRNPVSASAYVILEKLNTGETDIRFYGLELEGFELEGRFRGEVTQPGL